MPAAEAPLRRAKSFQVPPTAVGRGGFAGTAAAAPPAAPAFNARMVDEDHL